MSYEERPVADPKKEARYVSALHTGLQVLVALLSLVILIWPRALANGADLDANDSNHDRILGSGSL
jgi:hypothetical protein